MLSVCFLTNTSSNDLISTIHSHLRKSAVDIADVPDGQYVPRSWHASTTLSLRATTISCHELMTNEPILTQTRTTSDSRKHCRRKPDAEKRPEQSES